MMGKYQDRRKSRFETDIGYIKGESPQARHDRRQNHNITNVEKIRNYCKANGFKFQVSNENMHWQIKRGNLQVDWWPRTAKMVVNQKWKQGIHVHDIKQLKSYLDFVLLLQG